MLPFALLLSLLPLIHAQDARPSPTKTSVLRGIIPPYRAGPATYYASVIAIGDDVTAFAITCLEPTTFPTPDPMSRDPCLRSSLGTDSQTFTQGNGTWYVDRAVPTKEPYFTRCTHRSQSTSSEFMGGSGVSSVPLLDVDVELLECVVKTKYGDFPVSEETSEARRYGMMTQLVTVTDGFDVLGEPTPTGEVVSSGSGAFTDIGATRTRGAPGVTITLQVIGAGSKTGSLGMVSLITAFGTALALVAW